jgi:hypothetical protein
MRIQPEEGRPQGRVALDLPKNEAVLNRAAAKNANSHI